ncbi:hypothetical protein [Streptomyces marianii]|uniref:hypothetical protein n=1 Tax=Streptomyces marianii TaxID=1817406 RepID=UPI0018F8CE5A|nr:hypothetical protein [Streptomyces marianii]
MFVPAWRRPRRPAALLVGPLFTKADRFSGPPAGSWIGRNGPGRAVTVVVAGTPYALLPRTAVPAAADGRGGDAEEEPVRTAVSI